MLLLAASAVRVDTVVIAVIAATRNKTIRKNDHINCRFDFTEEDSTVNDDNDDDDDDDSAAFRFIVLIFLPSLGQQHERAKLAYDKGRPRFCRHGRKLE